MADGALFEFTSEKLAARCSLDDLAIRGTVRIALRDSGLDAKSVSRQQMEVVLEKVLPPMLFRRGVDDAEQLCQTVSGELDVFQGAASAGHAPEAFVARTRASR